MAKKESKLLNIKARHVLIGPIIFILIIALLITLGLLIKDNLLYAELLIACLLWLMPLCSLVSFLVGFKGFKEQKKLNKINKPLLIATISDVLFLIAPITFVILIKNM